MIDTFYVNENPIEIIFLCALKQECNLNYIVGNFYDRNFDSNFFLLVYCYVFNFIFYKRIIIITLIFMELIKINIWEN